jgi:cyclopropane-fatty-acyl-phospholipid synthase
MTSPAVQPIPPASQPSQTTLGQRLAERGWLPDALVRIGIRRLVQQRRADESSIGIDGEERRAFLESLSHGPIAVHTAAANEQHYEVPALFYQRVLGPNLKYSSGLWPDGVDTLAAAEEAMLELTCERAGLADGMEILELGCGWGSLSLWMAARFPGSTILAVSNSNGQREFIESTARERGLENLRVVTSDINDFEPAHRFDRVVSVEMFEHMRNWDLLLARVSSWLRPDGAAFVHTFCHREFAYPYEAQSDDDWMARFFFTGGIMPSMKLIHRFDRNLEVAQQWEVGGLHYARTCRAWLENLDRRRSELVPAFEQTYGEGNSAMWIGRWRLFFMACEELFRFDGGREWFVVHSLLRPRSGEAQA